MEPLTDSDVPQWWQQLGLPGLFDIHTHFLPERMMRRVWAHFDEAGPLIGRPWPIEYRWTQERRLDHLRQLGVRRFTALTYAHRPGMAGDLNDFALSLSATEPDCIPSATFFPEDGVLSQCVPRSNGARGSSRSTPRWVASTCESLPWTRRGGSWQTLRFRWLSTWAVARFRALVSPDRTSWKECCAAIRS